MATIPKRIPAPWENSKRTGFQEEGRKTDPRYHTTRWRKLRQLVLAQNPLCVMCAAQNIVTAATDVDHIVPVKLDDSGFWIMENLQGLCSHHHKSKSARERHG